MPAQVRFVAYIIPTTIGIVTIRQIAITGLFDVITFLTSIGTLALLAVALWTLGLASFRYAEKWTKERGSMGGF